MRPEPSPSELLVAVAEPTRLRILNCLAAAPLFVSELQDILALPQPTVSRHLTVLRRIHLVRDTPIAQFVLYRLHRGGRSQEELLSAILDALCQEEGMREERGLALARSRTRVSRPASSADGIPAS